VPHSVVNFETKKLKEELANFAVFQIMFPALRLIDLSIYKLHQVPIYKSHPVVDFDMNE